jgi:hypothetical protein
MIILHLNLLIATNHDQYHQLILQQILTQNSLLYPHFDMIEHILLKIPIDTIFWAS